MKIGKTLGTILTGLVVFASPFSVFDKMTGNQTAMGPQLLHAAEVVRSLSLDERVERLEQQKESRSQILAGLQFKINDMQEEIRNLLGTQEENNYRLTQLTERQREIYKDVDSRLTEARQQLQNFLTNNSLSKSASSSGNSHTFNAQRNKRVARAATKGSQRATSSEESNSYEKIFPLVREKKYVKAIAAYQSFIASYPDGVYAVNAHYWLGQVHFVQGQLDEASQQFTLVKDKFPQSRKAPDALLKLAIIFKTQGENEKAKGMFKTIIKDYPGSSTARLAIRRLRELN